jgi:uncharacterized integral membrane protein
MTKAKLRLIFALTLLGLVLIFALQNVAPVEVQFLLWGLALPRSLLIFLVLMVGVIAGWFLRGAMRRTGK